MENSNIIFGITNLSTGILFIMLSIPLAHGKIPMNSFYGFRIQKALSSDENWYKINEYGGKQMLKWSFMLVGIGILNFIFPSTEQYNVFQSLLYSAGPMLICVFVVITKTVLFSKTLEQ